MNKTVAILILVFSLLALPACSGEGGFAPLATATRSPTVTPLPTPTVPDPLLIALSNGLLDGQQAEVEKKKAEAAALYAEVERDNAAQQHGFKMTEQSFAATVSAASVRDTQTALPTKTPQPTTTPLPFQWTATVAISNAEVERIEGDTELVTLAVDRQEMKNWLDAYLPWTLLISAMVIGASLAYLGLQVSTLKRDRNGMLGAQIFKKSDGKTVVVRPDLMKTAFATISDNGDVTEGGDTSEFQQNTTRRQQLVEVGRGRNMNEFQQVIRMLGGPSATPGSGVNYFDADRLFKSILKDAEEDLIEGEATDVT